MTVLLQELPDVEVGGEVGSALLREAAVTGQAEMFERLRDCSGFRG